MAGKIGDLTLLDTSPLRGQGIKVMRIVELLGISKFNLKETPFRLLSEVRKIFSHKVRPSCVYRTQPALRQPFEMPVGQILHH